MELLVSTLIIFIVNMSSAGLGWEIIRVLRF